MNFEEFWEQEERKGLLHRMRDEYPLWQRRRRIRRTTLASVAVVAVAVFSLFTSLFPLSGAPHCYDAVCCNRSGIAEGHWAEVASNILTTPTI